MADEKTGGVPAEGVAGEEAGGIGTGNKAQTTSEAVKEEKARREEMSEAELEEAKTRDRLAKALEADTDRKVSSVPNVGSPDVEGREDSNLADAAVGPNEKFGTGPDERTHP